MRLLRLVRSCRDTFRSSVAAKGGGLRRPAERIGKLTGNQPAACAVYVLSDRLLVIVIGNGAERSERRPD